MKQRLLVLILLLLQNLTMATGVTTLRESEVEFSAGILMTDTIDIVKNPVVDYPKEELVENYLEWFSANEAERGTINITLLEDDDSGDSLYVYVRNIFFEAPEEIDPGVSVALTENYHAGISGISENVIINYYDDPLDPTGVQKSNFYTSLQVGASKFGESIWILENDSNEMIVDAYKSVDFGYNPAGDQNLAINAFGGDVVFFDNMVVSARDSEGCVGLNMSKAEMENGDCDTYGLEVNGNIKFNKLFGKVGDIHLTTNAEVRLEDATALAFDDTPWNAVTFNPTGDTNSNESFTIAFDNSVDVTYNIAVMSQYTVRTKYDTTVQGWMVVDAWDPDCGGPDDSNCAYIGDGASPNCQFPGAGATRYPVPGAFTDDEQKHVSNIAVFDFHHCCDNRAPYYYQFGFVAPIAAGGKMSIRVRHCLMPAMGKDYGEYSTHSLKSMQDDLTAGNGDYFYLNGISSTVYAVPSW